MPAPVGLIMSVLNERSYPRLILCFHKLAKLYHPLVSSDSDELFPEFKSL